MMRRLAANLTLLFAELPFLERFAAAKQAGFGGVEVLFPFGYAPEAITEQLKLHDLTLVLHNTPAPDWDAGDRGLAALPGQETTFQREFARCLRYAEQLQPEHIHIMAGLSAGPDARRTFIKNLRWASSQSPHQSFTIEPINSHDMPGYFLNDFDLALDILEEVGADPGKLRIAFATQPWSSAPVDPEVAEAVRQTAKVLAGLGHALAEDKPVCDWEPFISATADIWSVGVAGWVLGTDAGRNAWRETVENSVIACVERGIEMSALDYGAAVARMNVVTRTVAPFFADYDLLVTPTLALPPQPLGTYDANAPGLTALSWSEHIFSFAAFTPLFNATGHPAISLPLAQTRAGLPIGIQIVAPFGREDMLFRVAAQLEQAMDWSERRPQIFAGCM